MGAIILVVGIIGVGALIAALIVFSVTRSRRNGAGPVNLGVGAYPPHAGYPSQQPTYPPAQPPYPATPQDGYPAPPGQQVQHPHPHPYPQHPPHPGQ